MTQFQTCVFVVFSNEKGQLQVLLQRTPSHDIAGFPLVTAGQWRPTYVLSFDREQSGTAVRDAIVKEVGRWPESNLPDECGNRRSVLVLVEKAELRTMRKPLESGEFRPFTAEALRELTAIDPLIDFQGWNKSDAMHRHELHAALRAVGAEPEATVTVAPASDVQEDPLSLPTGKAPPMPLYQDPAARIGTGSFVR